MFADISADERKLSVNKNVIMQSSINKTRIKISKHNTGD